MWFSSSRLGLTTRGCPIQSRSVRLSGVEMQPAIPGLPLGPKHLPFLAEASNQDAASYSQRSRITSDLWQLP